MKAFAPSTIINKLLVELTPEESRRQFVNYYTSLLKNKSGLSYLCMKYPDLSVTSAIREYLAEAWKVENSNLV